MSLTESQCKHLRGRGHGLKTVVLVGSGGLNDRVLAEINRALERHELIKVRVHSDDRDARDALIRQLVSGSAAELVQRIGNVALLYRAGEKPTIVLPP